MAFYPSQSDIRLLFQPSKQIFSKVELLNQDFRVVDSLEGSLISDSCSIDAASSARRSYRAELLVTDSSFEVGTDKKIWFNRYIRPYVGIYSLREKRVVWYCKGTYCPSIASHSYNASANTLSLTCLDLMCMLNGEMDGIQTGRSFTIPAGEDIRSALIGIIKAFGFYKHRIEDLPRTVPYDCEFDAGAGASAMIEKLMEFCPNYEYFFDLDGTFVVQRMPCYTNDPDILDESVFQRLLISQDSHQVHFTAKNCVEVWGKSWSEETIDHMASSCTYDNGLYRVTFENLSSLTEQMVFAAEIPADNMAGCRMELQTAKASGTNGSSESFGTFSITDDYGRPLKEQALKGHTTCLFRYAGERLCYLGTFEIHAVCKNESPDSPFSVQNVGRELWTVCAGGEYETISSDTLAKERAMYECFYKANLNEELSLTLTDIPWLDVSKKLTYTLQGTGQACRWMIHSISSETMSGQCTLSLTRFYPDWS